eukprot:GHVT01088234.1.p1 GENE.GHVT01088234.1~~GHVT01088234.1.p1  ORF type:complete len:160 (-),score=28.67 GHVT01088234.1:480-959(-)
MRNANESQPATGTSAAVTASEPSKRRGEASGPPHAAGIAAGNGPVPLSFLERVVDEDRTEFRSYLEKQGVMQNLTRALVDLFEMEEWPSDATRFLQENLGKDGAAEDIGALRNTVQKLQLEKAELEKKLESLTERLQDEANGSEEASEDRRPNDEVDDG